MKTTFDFTVTSTAEEYMNNWFKKHSKTYLQNDEDLKNLVSRKRRHIRRAKDFATGVTLALATICGYWIYNSGATATSLKDIILITGLHVILWVVFYLLKKDDGKKNREVFDSLRQFQRDWHQLQKLIQASEASEYDLRELGKEIAEAARRRDEETEKKLMAKFKKHHRTLLNFGIINSADWGDFIPKPQSILETGNGDRVGF